MDYILSPSDFVAVFNQTIEYAYPNVTIVGELTNFKISKNKWVYFDLKDDYSSVKFFGTVYSLPGPLEDGMMVQVTGQPRLSPQYGFSINVQSIMPVGEGSLVKAAQLLQAKLEAEGLFDASRKRSLPYPPSRIALVASGQSAAYADFIKILDARWGGVNVLHVDVQVQGEQAVTDIVKAIDDINQLPEPPEVLVLVRGGGSADDLAAFSTEQVTRAVAASRVPTIVAIGHEIDVCMAELAADQRASTPSNAAELLVPDKKTEQSHLKQAAKELNLSLTSYLDSARSSIAVKQQSLYDALQQTVKETEQKLAISAQLLGLLNPESALQRGYAIVKHNDVVISSVKNLKPGSKLGITLHDGHVDVSVDKIGTT